MLYQDEDCFVFLMLGLIYCIFVFSLLSLLLLCYFNMFKIKPQKGTGYVSILLTQSMQLNIILQKLLLCLCVLI